MQFDSSNGWLVIGSHLEEDLLEWVELLFYLLDVFMDSILMLKISLESLKLARAQFGRGNKLSGLFQLIFQILIFSRLTEFRSTASSQLTINQFLQIDLTTEANPPAYKNKFIRFEQNGQLSQLESTPSWRHRFAFLRHWLTGEFEQLTSSIHSKVVRPEPGSRSRRDPNSSDVGELMMLVWRHWRDVSRCRRVGDLVKIYQLWGSKPSSCQFDWWNRSCWWRQQCERWWRHHRWIIAGSDWWDVGTCPDHRFVSCYSPYEGGGNGRARYFLHRWWRNRQSNALMTSSSN